MKMKRCLAFVMAAVIGLSAMLPLQAEAESTRVSALLADMTLEEKIEQMMMVDFRLWDEDLTDETGAQDFVEMNDQVRGIVESYDFGAIIYFANNIKTTEQSLDLSAEMQKAAMKDGGIPMLVAADQEGGSVYRLGSGTALPGNMALGATGNVDYAKKAGQIVGSEISAVGINTNLAPVVDVNNNANNPVIGIRSFGDDAVSVGELASEFVEGMSEYNVVACAKHFPGHGDTAIDSHYGLPSVDKSKEVLQEVELKPFQILIDQDIDMIMTAHILYPQLDDSKIYSEKTGKEESLPATMSETIISGLLKDEMGFDGIVCTDAMNMEAVANMWNPTQAVVNAIAAGVDMVCMPCQLSDLEDLDNLDTILAGVKTAVEDGVISGERIDDAVTRILTVKEESGILDYDRNDFSVEKANAVVGCDENREAEREMAAAAVTVVKNDDDILPLKVTEESKVLMLCPYNNERAQLVMGWNRAKNAGLVPEGAVMQYFRYTSDGLTDEIKEKIDWADTVFILTEVANAARMGYKHWLSKAPNDFVNYAYEGEKKSVVISADKPYDVQHYENADAIMAVYGCKGSAADPTEALTGGITGTDAAYGPNIIAGVEVALGVFGASGKLPVHIPVFDIESGMYLDELAYERGYGIEYDALESADDPEEPGKPEEPAVPGEPDDPDEPEDVPEVPEEPDDPTDSEKPDKPEKPEFSGYTKCVILIKKAIKSYINFISKWMFWR